MTYSEIKRQHPDWNIFPIAKDMKTIINCANCGKQVELGNTYTSREHYTDSGDFGLQVCGDCYFKED